MRALMQLARAAHHNLRNMFVLSALQSWLKDASNTFQGLDGPVSTAYALLTASLLAAGLGYIFAPGLTLAGVGWRTD
jgi:hypothetical protein